jgi:hypothetical protein
VAVIWREASVVLPKCGGIIDIDERSSGQDLGVG